MRFSEFNSLRDAEIVNVPFLVVLGDAVLGVSSAVWLATQTRHNDAMRPPVPSKNGILAVSASLRYACRTASGKTDAMSYGR